MEDKDWVESNFLWLLESLGPVRLKEMEIILPADPVLQKSPEEILTIFCQRLDINRELVKIEFYDDIGSKQWTLISPAGDFQEILSESKEISSENGPRFDILIAKSVLEEPVLLSSLIAYELVKIKLLEEGLKFSTGPDTFLFLYLATVYFGFGLLISDSIMLRATVFETEKPIPAELIGYALALHAWLRGDEQMKEHLNTYVKPHFEVSYQELLENPPEDFDKLAIDVSYRFEKDEQEAFKLYSEGNAAAAVEILKKWETIAPDPILLNNIGYYLLRMEKYEESIPYFDRAIEMEEEFSYPFDNKGFAEIMLGRLEDAQANLNQALMLDDQNGYCYRNYGILHSKLLQFDTAFEYFQKALAIDPELELGHYYWGMALLENGDLDEAVEHFKISLAKGEKESLKMLERLGKAE